jgi:hypothetical protein
MTSYTLENKQLYISGFDTKTTEENIIQTFNYYGMITFCKIIHNRYGFIQFQTQQQTEYCLRNYKNRHFNLHVSYAKKNFEQASGPMIVSYASYDLYKICIQGIHNTDITEWDIERYAAKYGSILEVSMQSRQAIVEFVSTKSANEILNIQNHYINSYPVNITRTTMTEKENIQINANNNNNTTNTLKKHNLNILILKRKLEDEARKVSVRSPIFSPLYYSTSAFSSPMHSYDDDDYADDISNKRMKFTTTLVN